MATGGPPGPKPIEVKKAALTCYVCLEIFTCPKALPCLHTYCLKCIEELASRHGGKSFPCPQCRRDVSVPPRGVAAFPSNFHILSEELARARDKSMCVTHPDQVVDAYCEDCQQVLCVKCALFKHRQHGIKEMHEAAKEARRQLQEDEVRLEEVVSYLTELVIADNRELQSARDKKAAVEAAIRRRHASLVSVVNKCRDDMLASLDTVSADIENEVITELDRNQKKLDQVCQLQQQVQGAVQSEADHEAVTVAVLMREGRGRDQAVNEMTSQKRSSIYRPVYRCKLTEDITPLVQNLFGFVEKVTMEVKQPEVKVEEQFRCGEEADTEVFSVCPIGDGNKVWLSFAWRGMKEDAPCEYFDKKGNHINTFTTCTGKVSIRGRSKYNSIITKNTEMFATFDKSQNETIFDLSNETTSHEGHIKTVKVTSNDPLKVEDTTLFTISVGPHRALDVDSTQKFFVVIEEEEEKEGSPGSVKHKVMLYLRGQRDAVASYQPPSASCRPIDACFWRQPDGQEILVVADEATDSLHALNVEGGALKFEGYLAAGCPLIVQPTALNTDTRGRLWVALRGGKLLILSYVT